MLRISRRGGGMELASLIVIYHVIWPAERSGPKVIALL